MQIQAGLLRSNSTEGHFKVKECTRNVYKIWDIYRVRKIEQQYFVLNFDNFKSIDVIFGK